MDHNVISRTETGARTLRLTARLCLIATILGAALRLPAGTWPSADSASAEAPAPAQLPHRFDIEGPFPTRQKVKLVAGGAQGFTVELPGGLDADQALRFRFRLDAGACAYFHDEGADLINGVRTYPAGHSGPSEDCGYDYDVRDGLNGDDMTLPEGASAVPVTAILPDDDELIVSRYADDLVRVRIGGTLVGAGEKPMGGVRAIFSYCSNFGGYEPATHSLAVGPTRPPCPAEAAASTHGYYYFDTCDPEDPSPCYRMWFSVSALSAEPEPGGDASVTEVWGESDRCVAGEEFAFGVKLDDPDRPVRVSLLDPTTHTVAEAWQSGFLRGPARVRTPDDIETVRVRLPSGEHRLMVSAIAADGANAASAAELTIRCIHIAGPEHFPDITSTPTQDLQIPGIDVRLPTPTTTPRPGLPDRDILRPTPTSTPERPGVRLPNPR